MVNSINFKPALVSKQKVNVISHIDASEGVIEPYMAERVDSLRASAHSEQIDATVKIYRGGSTPSQKIKKGLITLGVQASPIVIGTVLGGAIGFGVGTAISYGLHKLGITRLGVGNLASGLTHRDKIKDGDWKGSQVHSFEGQKESQSERQLGDELSAEKTEKFLSSEMKPGEVNVLHLAGHGMGIQQSAGLRTSSLAKAMGGANEKSGLKPDVIVFESCLQGNLEALSLFDDKARYAIVAQEPLAAEEKSGGLPLEKMLRSLSESPSVETGVHRMMGQAARHGVHTLAAIDLEKFQEVPKSLDKLGLTLIKEILTGKLETIQEAAKKSPKMGKKMIGSFQASSINEIDLGKFLSNLQSSDISKESKAAVKETHTLLQDSVLSQTKRLEYADSTGISFNPKLSATDTIEKEHIKMLGKFGEILGLKEDTGRHEDADLPGNWNTFITVVSDTKIQDALLAAAKQAEAKAEVEKKTEAEVVSPGEG